MNEMPCSWTATQKQRLQELNAPREVLERTFSGHDERNRAFHQLEDSLAKKARKNLVELRNTFRRSRLSRLQDELTKALTEQGFVQVTTPHILAKGLLAKMSITEKHPLFKQVYWVDKNRCLRPMLAPNLYYLLRLLEGIWEKPIKIFEIGSCFRKESEGTDHLTEFTMLNLVELGTEKEQREQRLAEMAELVMGVVGISGYRITRKQCAVYGETIDVLAGIEVGSGAMGPHPLDSGWGLVDPWVGIGFGLERLLKVREGNANIRRFGRSLIYLDGERLNV